MVIKILNLKRTLDKFENLEGIDIMPEIRDATRKVQRTAKELAPVGTPESTGKKGYVGGTLRESIKTKLYPKEQSGVVYTLTEYAIYQEFGTSKMKAQPFLNPAMNRHRAGINQSLKAYIKEQLKERT